MGDLFIPTECLSGYSTFLLVKALLPIVLLLVGIFAYTVVHLREALRTHARRGEARPEWGRFVRESAKAIGLSALPLALWSAIFFCVSVSSSVFNGFQ